MAGKSDLSYGNVAVTMLLQVVASGAATGAGLTTQLNVTVPGLLVGDQVSTVSKATFQAGLLTTGAVTAVNQLTINFYNISAGSITPTVGDTYVLEVNRQSALGNALPSALV